LIKYSWPSNIKELENLIERMCPPESTDILRSEGLTGGIIKGVEPTASVPTDNDPKPYLFPNTYSNN